MVEITGIIALMATFFAFFMDNKRAILLIQWISLVSFWIHFWLLWSIASSLFLLLQVWRNIFFALEFKRIHEHLFLICLIWVFIYIYTQNKSWDPLSWLSLFGSIVWSIAFWMKKTSNIRFIFLISAIFWTYYTLQIWSMFAILVQSTLVTWLLINIIRFDILPKFRK